MLDIIWVMCYYDNSRQMMVCFLSRIHRQEADQTNESKSDGVPYGATEWGAKAPRTLPTTEN